MYAAQTITECIYSIGLYSYRVFKLFILSRWTC